MFENLTRKRLLEIAGVPMDDESGEPGPEATEEHLDKEESVFHRVHDALEELLSFMQSQEGFEEKRGKEEQYAEMENDAEDLLQTMKRHLEGYKQNEHPMAERWEHPGDVHHTGQNTDKSIAELRKELANARKRHDTKEIRQKAFAIRAKRAHGGKWKGVTAKAA